MFRRIRIALVAVLLLLAVGMFGCSLACRILTVFTIENTRACTAEAADVVVTRSDNSVYIQIVTTEPDELLYIPPYVTEYAGEELLTQIEPGTALSFRISGSEAEMVKADTAGGICALEADGVVLYTLEDCSQYMADYVRPIQRAGYIAGTVFLAAAVILLLTVRRGRRKGT